MEEWRSLSSMELPAYEVSTKGKVRNAGRKYILKGYKAKDERYYRLKNINGITVKLTIEELMKIFDEPEEENRVKHEEEKKEIIEDDTEEIWRSLDFLSLSKYEISTHQRVRNVQSGKILKGTTKSGYHSYSLTNNEGKEIIMKRSKLMLDTFVGYEENKTVDHINRQRDDDRISNLRYATKSEQNLNRNLPLKKWKSVQQFKEGIKTRVFNDAREAAKVVDGTIRDIRNACHNRKSYRGFEWCYEEDIDLPGEVWKDGNERFPELGSFLVSNLGRIRRDTGTTYGCLLDGYRVVNLFYGDNSRKSKKVHRLVCGVFSNRRRNDLQVNHKDGNKENNTFENLEYATNSGNSIHAYNTGLNSSRKEVDQLSMEGKFIALFTSMREAENKTGVHRNRISDVCRGTAVSTGGFKWRYSDPNKVKPSAINRVTKRINYNDEEGNLIKTYDSIVKVCNDLSISRGSVRNVCQGKSKSSKGYYFSYADSDSSKHRIVNRITKPVDLIDENGNILKTFESIIKVHEELHIGLKEIRMICRGELDSYRGYYFKFSNSLDCCGNNARAINQVDVDKNIIRTFISISETHRILKVGYKDIRAVCMGEQKTAKGFYFSFANNKDKTEI